MPAPHTGTLPLQHRRITGSLFRTSTTSAIPRVDGYVQDGTPDGLSFIDPHRHPSRHLLLPCLGGVHESVDGGRTGHPSSGIEVVEGVDAATVTFHDPIRPALSEPIQTGCITEPAEFTGWIVLRAMDRIGKNMPKKAAISLSDGPPPAHSVPLVFQWTARRVARVSPGANRCATSRAMRRPGQARTMGFPRANACDGETQAMRQTAIETWTLSRND